jgi:hypothetical protein
MPYRTSLIYTHQNAAGTGKVRDVSSDGLFLETPRALSVGEQLAIDFRFRHGQTNMAITGEITRTTPHGVGIRLIW